MDKFIRLSDLMVLERLLLEIDVRYKFDLGFDEAYKLYAYLKRVGAITNYMFLLQDEYYKKYDDKDKLKEYHDRITKDKVEVEYEDITRFIDAAETVYGDEEFKELVNSLRFWGEKGE